MNEGKDSKKAMKMTGSSVKKKKKKKKKVFFQD